VYIVLIEKYGIYHATNEGVCSWAEFAEEILRLAGKKVRVKSVTTKEYNVGAARPLNSRLSKKSLDDAGFSRLPHWRDALFRYFLELQPALKHTGKRIAVTGASGYIGRYVVKTLLDYGCEVTAVSRHLESVDPRALRLSIDIFQQNKDMFKALNEPEVLIHLAWTDGFIHDSDCHLINLPKHYAFIKSMLYGGLKHLVVMGTMHEVGYWEGAIDEKPRQIHSLFTVSRKMHCARAAACSSRPSLM
jgi:nucleoside-diphosphate-sugar epimerase